MAEQNKNSAQQMVDRALGKMLPNEAIDTDKKVNQMLEW